MRVLINLATLKAGGGQNVGLNFVASLFQDKSKFLEYYFILAKDSDIYHYFINNNLTNFSITPRNPILRMIKEFLFGGNLIKRKNIDIIYSYFGIGLYPKNIPQVTGSADSNLYFPEIDFWCEYRGLSRLKKRMVDKYRIWGLKRADGIIFENIILEQRFHELYNFNKLTRFIKPSISSQFLTKQYKMPSDIRENASFGLFLCGWHLNKNIMLIPEIASELKNNNIEFHFILTAPLDNSSEHQQFKKLIEKYKVSSMVSVIGQVKKENIASLYEQIDFVFLLSKLESFSNNIIEAWTYKKILIIADEPWSRAICDKAAVYVNRNSSSAIANEIKSILENKLYYEEIVKNGTEILKSYPTIETRVHQELKFLRFVYENT